MSTFLRLALISTVIVASALPAFARESRTSLRQGPAYAYAPQGEFGRANSPYVSPRQLHRGWQPSVAYTWGEKRSFDRASQASDPAL